MDEIQKNNVRSVTPSGKLNCDFVEVVVNVLKVKLP